MLSQTAERLIRFMFQSQREMQSLALQLTALIESSQGST